MFYLDRFLDGQGYLFFDFAQISTRGGVVIIDHESPPGRVTRAELNILGAVVPEPSTILLLAAGVVGLALIRIRRLLSIFIPLAVLLASPPPSYAAIVFDFEDGLQGWELVGAVTRVQTQVLGGEWAIFGDGFIESGASISIEMDFSDIASVSVEQLFVDGSGDGLFLIAFFRGDFAFAVGLEVDVIEPGNPSLRAVDVSRFTGPLELGIGWGFDSELGPGPIVAFIDNITFHPVPEPSPLALLASGLVALVIYRRRIV